MASGSYRYESGQPWGRILVVTSGLNQGFDIVRTERLVRNSPARNTADVRIEKTLRLGSGPARVGLFADIFNVTNAGVPRGYVQQSGSRFGLPVGWIEPRTLSAGTRLIF